MIDEAVLFLPIAAPVRWSLVSPSVSGFAANQFARHPLTGLQQRLSAKGLIDADYTAQDRLPFPGFGSDPESVRARVEALERILERLVVIPGINRPVGLDVILDLVPFAGSTAGAVLGAYMAWEARNLGMSKWQMTRMARQYRGRFPARADPLGRRYPRFPVPIEQPQSAGSSNAISTSIMRGRRPSTSGRKNDNRNRKSKEIRNAPGNELDPCGRAAAARVGTGRGRRGAAGAGTPSERK